MPRGPVSVTAEGSPERLTGSDFMMAAYALGARRYMAEFRAPREAFAQVSVKAHRNAAINPYSHYKKVFTLEEVLNSRMIADPLTLYQCCPTSEGTAAAVICAREVAPKYVKDMKRVATIAGAALRTTKYAGGEGKSSQYMLAARDAYEIAGVHQVKDAQVGLAECSGAGGVCTVFIVKK